MRVICLVLYYLVARWMPASYSYIGGVSKKFRYILCKHIFQYCGKNVNIEKGAYFGTGRNVVIGDNSGIGVECVLPNDIKIGCNVMMAPQSYFLPSISHRTDRIDIPMREQGNKVAGSIVIEDDCWIGVRCIVNAGRTIRKGSILAAGTVLHKDYPEYSIIGGNPSKLIKDRKSIV